MSNPKKRRGGRGMFEIRPGKHRPKNIRNGAIFVTLIALLMFMLYGKPTVPGFGTKGQTITADVSDGINIRSGSTPVRVKGVEVGEVTKVERAPSGRGVRVTMLVEEGKGVTVRKDATVAFRWRTLLGRNIYADVVPGSASAPVLSESEVIPQSRTETQTELDQAVEPFDATGRKSVKTIIAEFEKGFGAAEGYQRTAKALGPAMRSLGPGLRSIRGQEEGDLQKAIQGTSRVLGAVARDEQNLGELINNGSVALGVTAARSADLQGILAAAPGALRETRATMSRLRTTLDVLDPVADELRPGARRLAGSSDDARTLLTAAAPLLRDAKPTVRALRPAVQDLTKLTTSGNALMAEANPVLDDAVYPILPWLRTDSVEAKVKQFQTIGPFLSVATGIVSQGDRYGTMANFEAGFGESVAAVSPCQTFITNEVIPLDQKVQCEIVSRILTGLYTGQSPDQVALKGTTTPNSQLTKMLKDTKIVKNLTRTVLKNQKLLKAKQSQKTKQEAGR